MKIAFYGTKPYDRVWFEPMGKEYGFDIHFIEASCSQETVFMAKGCDAICIFVNDYVNAGMIDTLYEMNVKAILLRSAGFNNVDVKAAEDKIVILRVPSYSPEAVAEHAMALALASNRRLYKAYNKVRENDFSLSGLMGFNFYQKTAGIIGTGKIGAAMCRICHGFGMKVMAYDVYQNDSLKDFVEYVSLEHLLSDSDVISLHCPLMDSTYHLINIETIKKMKDGVILVNTSRGALVKTNDLIEGIRMHKFAGVGLDVYEEETNNVFEDRSDEILEHSTTARLLSFPNVMITSHQGFFTREALGAIASTTLQNASDFAAGKDSPNDVPFVHGGTA